MLAKYTRWLFWTDWKSKAAKNEKGCFLIKQINLQGDDWSIIFINGFAGFSKSRKEEYTVFVFEVNFPPSCKR